MSNSPAGDTRNKPLGMGSVVISKGEVGTTGMSNSRVRHQCRTGGHELVTPARRNRRSAPDLPGGALYRRHGYPPGSLTDYRQGVDSG
jgi:hypothetical protein